MDTSKQKPDLMSSNRVAADGGKRILAHLEHGPKTASKPARTSGWTIDGWTIGLGLLVLTICMVAWLVHDDTLTPSSFAHSRSSVRTHFERRPIEAVEPQAAASPPAVQAAAIVNESITRPVPTPAPASHPPSTATAPPPHTLASSEAPHAAGPAHRQAGAASTAAAPAARLPVARPAVAATAAAPGDTDVALLAALVAHSNKPAAVLPERSRDVVERQEGDSTAQLLARCKQLGLIEGMLCRSRICSGRWDADPACNAPSH
ncbi:hypothetical protein [Duganella violaceipulchra]|uniref:Uncharacterized protein n=2 Tax=Duganella violaceipulchra TaxID=2849652 RepID=A0ABT1GIN8_9BURK|nr:hypothetical protein [Duganella violaceicalia]